MPNTIGIIDVGSNSIKLLVANELATVYESLKGTRISTGIGGEDLKLSTASLAKGLESITELHEAALKNGAKKMFIVATSAVREASNADQFCEMIEKATGVKVKVLTGDEEAKYIARGVLTDPALKGEDEFCLFDAGGGSLECVHYKNEKIVYAESLPFGIVRLTEKFIENPSGQVSEEDLEKVMNAVEEGTHHGFPHRGVPLVGTGGGLSAARVALKQDAVLEVKELRRFMRDVAEMTMYERMEEFGIPEYRADLMPAALALTIALCDKAGASKLIHSYCNLRFGLMDKLLLTDLDIHPDGDI